MDNFNFSVLASLVLLGLFLISCPAEGFVTRYRYIGLSDPRLQSSLLKRLAEQEIMDAQIQAVMKRQDTMDGDSANTSTVSPKDGQVLVGSTPKPSMPIYNVNQGNPKDYEVLAGLGAAKDQNKDVNGAKRADGVIKVRYENNENDINAHNTASITVILPYPSKF